MGAHGVKLDAAPDAPPWGEVLACLPVPVRIQRRAVAATDTHPPTPTPPHPPGADGARRSRVRQGADPSGRLGLPRLSTAGTGASASAGASYCDASCGRRAARCGRARQRACRVRDSAGMADCTTIGPADRPEHDSERQRPNLRPAPAPWEGPLVSDTTDMITGSSGTPEEPASASPWPGQTPDPAGQAGASPSRPARYAPGQTGTPAPGRRGVLVRRGRPRPAAAVARACPRCSCPTCSG